MEEEKRPQNSHIPNGASMSWEKDNPDGLKYGAIDNENVPAENSKPSQCSTSCMAFLKKLVRKKVFKENMLEQTELRRCLSVFDLVNLGVGSCICNGIYIVVGEVAKDVAGPAVFLSFLVAGIASAFAAMCYAEFATRVPRAGSAYVYSYVTVGELMAFVIGWNLLLEYIIGTASSARAWSVYFNSLINNSIKNVFREYMPMSVNGFSTYPDFFSLGITLLMTVLLAVGVRESARFNNIFNGVNIFVIVYVIICGLFKVNFHNWQLSPSEVPREGAGTGGFFPFGFSGMMSGAATCFYAYVGFDCIATTGEESKDPEKTIPISVVLALLVILVSYCSVSAVVTLMCPYFLLDINTPVPFVFQYVHWDIARYIIAIGAMCGLSTSLLGSMFPLPRVLYAMGSDGLIFRSLASISPRFKTPFIGTMISGIFAGVLGMVFSLAELIEMMSIGTLLAYTLVAVCVLILRYETDDNLPNKGSNRCEVRADDSPLRLRYLLFPPVTEGPSHVTSAITKCCVAAMCLLLTALSAMLIFCLAELAKGEPWAITLTLTLLLLVLVSLFCITRQPQNHCKLSFQVPLIPYVPAVSCFINIYLMLKLEPLTWMRFGIWMLIGFSVYFFYGIDNATMNQHNATDGRNEEEQDSQGCRSCCGVFGDRKDKKADSEPDH